MARLTVAGGFAKIGKLAQGALDLHSGRSQVDFDRFARMADSLGSNCEHQRTDSIRGNNAAIEALEIASTAGPELPREVAQAAMEPPLGSPNLRSIEVRCSTAIVDLARPGETWASRRRHTIKFSSSAARPRR